MHHKFYAFLLLALISVGAMLGLLPYGATAGAPVSVGFGVRVWNYNSTHTVSNALVAVLDKGSVRSFGLTNGTGWSNFTINNLNLGNYTLQVKLQDIIVYNNTLNVNQTTIYRNLKGPNNASVADYSFMLLDSLARPVHNALIDVRVNSTLVASTVSQTNGTAIAKDLPFHTFNVTLSREGVFVSNSTLTVNMTTYTHNTLLRLPNYRYSITARDYRGVNIVQNGVVFVYDWGVPTNNYTNPLNGNAVFSSLWPGKYWVVIIASNSSIWKSLETISSNTTRSVNANIGYSLTLHLFDALNRPIPSVPVNLLQNGIVIGTKITDAGGIVTFDNLPESAFNLNFTLLHRFYFASVNVSGAPVDLPFKIDDVMLLAGTPFNTAPLVAGSTLILTVIAALGTVYLYRRRRGGATTSADAKKSEGN